MFLSRSKREHLPQYMTYAYGIPLCIVIFSVTIEYTDMLQNFSIGYGVENCWIGNRTILYFKFYFSLKEIVKVEWKGVFWYNFDTVLCQFLETGISDRTNIGCDQLLKCLGLIQYPLSFYLNSSFNYCRSETGDLHIFLFTHALRCTHEQRALRPDCDQHQLRLLRGRVREAQGPGEIWSVHLYPYLQCTRLHLDLRDNRVLLPRRVCS